MGLEFFDTTKIKNLVDEATRRGLMQAGAYTRRVAMNSLRYRDGISDPDSPPFVHRSKAFTKEKKNRKTGARERQDSSPLRELIVFAYDTASRSVVVGPVLFRNARVPGLAPKILEKGGTATFESDGKIKKGNFRARPFMGPALKAASPKFPDVFRQSLR